MGLTIPSSVNSIGAGAFNGCSSLASLTDNGDGEWLVISPTGGSHEFGRLSDNLSTLKTNTTNSYSRE